MALSFFDNTARLGKSSFDAPSIVNASAQSTEIESQFSLPLNERLSFTVKGNKMGRTLIISLLNGSCPITILRSVVTVVILAFQRVLPTGSFAHILKKMLKRVKPTLANGNPTSAIVFILGRFDVQATIFHSLPNAVSGRTAHAVRHDAIPPLVSPKTAATFRCTAPQSTPCGSRELATLTATKPLSESLCVLANEIKRGQSPKDASSEVDKSRIVWMWNGRNVKLGIRHIISSVDSVFRAVGCCTLPTACLNYSTIGAI